MNFFDSVHLEDQVLRLGRVLEVLQTCLTDLKTHYATLRQNPASLPPADSSVHLPSPVSAASQQIAADLNLRFLYKLSRDTGKPVDPRNVEEWQKNTQHGVFVALGGGQNSIPDQEKVIVKFARRYNTEAHKMLAEKGLAPKLYYHCPVRGGLTMVVMEIVQGIMASLWIQKIRHPRALHSGASVLEDVQRAIEVLHSNNLVFGDLRLQNIMVCESNEKAHAFLVDFDWAGTAGEARYPATMSALREWAPTVEAYSVMEKEHDLHRLRAIARDDFKLI
jgi:serine/threonine protein kinase